MTRIVQAISPTAEAPATFAQVTKNSENIVIQKK